MNKSIRFAEKKDVPALCEIWRHCFSDSDEYIRTFYNKNFERINVLAYYINKKPVSVVHLIDAVFEDKGKNQKALFIYATGTLPEYRNRGYMGVLIEHLAEKAKREGLALFLKPSSAELLSYYEKFGFKLITLLPSEKQPFDFYELSSEEYNRLREDALLDIPHAKWDNAHIQWCIEENELFEGKTLGVKLENKEYFLLAYPEKNTLIINETNLSVNQLKKISGSLCKMFNTDSIKAYYGEYSCGECEQTISNLIYNSSVGNPYINLIMI